MNTQVIESAPQETSENQKGDRTGDAGRSLAEKVLGPSTDSKEASSEGGFEGTLSDRGYSAVEGTPFKDFDPQKGERFHISKRTDRSGREVVVKVTETEGAHGKGLEEETDKLHALKGGEEKYDEQAGARFSIQQAVELFKEGEFSVLVTEFAPSDPTLNDKLSPDRKVAILRGMIDYMQSLPPGELPREARDCVSTGALKKLGSMYSERAKDEAERERIAAEMGKLEAIIMQNLRDEAAQVGEVVVHGDPNGGNIRRTEGSDGTIDATIIDIEDAHVGSPYEDRATLYLYSQFGVVAEDYPQYEGALRDLWYKELADQQDTIEADAVGIIAEDPAASERYFRTWVVNVCVDKLTFYEDLLAQNDSEIYRILRAKTQEVLNENIAWLKKDSADVTQ